MRATPDARFFYHFGFAFFSPHFLLAPLLIVSAALVSRQMWTQQTARQSARGVKAAEGLEVALWAAEPDVVNPTNIDIDARGRIWVLEGVNYRRTLWKLKDYRTAGDRITILEDTDGNGRADKVKVFAQDLSLRSPLGIAVLGDKVIVSQSPSIIVYTKDDQDNILKKEVFLTGFKGVDHDHGVHAVVFGHDGRYYWNSGDTGFDVTDKSGRRLASGKSETYYAACSLRANPDGTGLTVLGHNFRNPYELALDSFGNIWQTDNDDDGNEWVRVNYVIRGGNFGYWGPGARRWEQDKGSHFHSELPGVVPNIARLGSGAPCGLVVYEGHLLPQKYRGQLIHAEAGRRFVNSYLLSNDGAGYSLNVEHTVTSADTQFRPSDVSVSPDGAVYISDWNDAVVGGHDMKDRRRGRIYRLAPAGHKPQRPEIDLESPSGLANALGSPAQAVRYLAYVKLKSKGSAGLPELLRMLKGSDPILKARALWLLGGIPEEGEQAVRQALKDQDSSFRILAIRVLELYGADLVQATQPLLRDPSPQVRREIAVALQDVSGEEALDSLLELCKQYDGKDRWYLEALGIAARGRENLLYSRLRAAFPKKWNSLLGQLLWEFRPSEALLYLIASVQDTSLNNQYRAEALESLSAMAMPEAAIAVAELVSSEETPSELAEKAFHRLSRRLFSEWSGLRKNPSVIAAVKKAFKVPGFQPRAAELAEDLEDPVYGPELLALVKDVNAEEEVRATAISALGKTGNPAYLPELEKLSQNGPVLLRVMAIRALGHLKPKGMESKLRQLILSSAPNEVRTEAVKILGRSEQGLNLLLDLEQAGELPAELRNVAVSVTNSSKNPAIRSRAQQLLPPLTSKSKRRLPPIEQLVWREGFPEKGKVVFSSTTGPKCKSCHSMDAMGQGKKSVGPDLSSIGSKLGKEALFESILNPSAGIAPEYYVWVLQTKSEGELIGIITEDTPQRMSVKTDTGDEFRFKPAEIISRRRSRLSMMPEDLVNTMTEQQLLDVVAFLTTLKEEARTAQAAGGR